MRSRASSSSPLPATWLDCRPSRASCRSSRVCDALRRGADFRRGDDRIPRARAAARRSLSGVAPDLTTLGKVIGGGMPVGAFGGAGDHGKDRAARARLPGRHAGGQSGRGRCRPRDAGAPIAEPGFYADLAGARPAIGRRFMRRGSRRQRDWRFRAQSIGGMFGIYFADPGSRISYASVMACGQGTLQPFLSPHARFGRFTSRRRRSKRVSFRRRTPSRTSTTPFSSPRRPFAR